MGRGQRAANERRVRTLAARNWNVESRARSAGRFAIGPAWPDTRVSSSAAALLLQRRPGCSTAHTSSEQFRHFAASRQSPEGIMERYVRFQPIFVNWL